MTPQEKAKELVEKYTEIIPIVPSDMGLGLETNFYGKRCALGCH
jgi:hypothetical protein